MRLGNQIAWPYRSAEVIRKLGLKQSMRLFSILVILITSWRVKMWDVVGMVGNYDNSA